MKRYIVYTHVGTFETCAPTERKAIANIRFRVYGRTRFASTWSWTAKEVG